MRILVFGAGAIGLLYGYTLSEVNHEVIHFVRENRAAQLKEGITVSILDGRDEKNVKEIKGIYGIKMITDFNTYKEFDLILVSIKHGSLEGALNILKENAIKGTILFFNGLWKDYTAIDSFIPRDRYLWGYPVAGGNIDYEKRKLEGAILDHIILGETDGSITDRLKAVEKLFSTANIKAEVPFNVLHWVWIHMAINGAVISTCLKYGSAEGFMNSTKALKEGIRTMRETLRIVEARGVDLNNYKNEIKMYYYPTFFSSVLFKHFFKKNILSRKIMTLHNNPEDLYAVCTDVYNTGVSLNIETPLFTEKKKYFLNQ